VTATARAPSARCAAFATTVLSMPPLNATATPGSSRNTAKSRSRLVLRFASSSLIQVVYPLPPAKPQAARIGRLRLRGRSLLIPLVELELGVVFRFAPGGRVRRERPADRRRRLPVGHPPGVPLRQI